MPIPSYSERLGAVLRQHSPVALRTFLREQAARFGDPSQVEDVDVKSDDEMEELMHRMIVARPDMLDDHRASREWLFKHGVDTFGEGGTRRN
ncbi:MAG: hypothetical protein HYX52_09245 [Chloroflexi bacterium]|nr:hypothetical protein [Chloroflexota bacterium]